MKRTKKVCGLIIVLPINTELMYIGYCRTYIVVPSTIYGLAKNPLVDADIQKNHSFAIPLLIKTALNRGTTGTVGKGLSRWPNVHIDDRE